MGTASSVTGRSLPMSALGHKPTYAVQNVATTKAMCALPSKADVCGAVADVWYETIADLRRPWLRRFALPLTPDDAGSDQCEL
jgi:hypothetical protein